MSLAPPGSESSKAFRDLLGAILPIEGLFEKGQDMAVLMASRRAEQKDGGQDIMGVGLCTLIDRQLQNTQSSTCDLIFWYCFVFLSFPSFSC
jgi:hypothetical protein